MKSTLIKAALVLNLIAALAAPSLATAESGAEDRNLATTAATAPVEPAQKQSPGSDAELGAPWWDQMDDPLLEKFIARGLAGAHDLQAYRHRIEQAEAISRQSLSALLPTVRGVIGATGYPYYNFKNANPTGAAQVAAQPGYTPPDYYGAGSASIQAGLEVDLFGRNHLGYKATQNAAIAQSHSADSYALALATRIASAYYDLVAANIRLRIIDQQIEINEKLLQLIEMRYKNGEANALDLLQQRQQAAAIRSQRPLALIGRDAGAAMLAVLIGGNPSAPPEVSGVSLPGSEIDIEANDGQINELIEKRPEIKAARLALKAAEQKTTAAYLKFMPTLNLSAQIGYQGSYFDELDYYDYWSVGASLTIPIFEGGRNFASATQNKAAEYEASENLKQSTLQVRQEIETNLIRYRRMAEYVEALKLAEQAAAAAFEKAADRYRSGVGFYVNLLSAQAAYHQAQITAVGASRDLVMARINLLNSLGGDWTDSIAKSNNGDNNE